MNTIQYIDMVNRALCYHLIDGSTVMGRSKRCSFQEMVMDFSENYPFAFSRVGVLVNLENVYLFKPRTNEILLKNGETTICSKTKVAEFRRKPAV